MLLSSGYSSFSRIGQDKASTDFYYLFDLGGNYIFNESLQNTSNFFSYSAGGMGIIPLFSVGSEENGNTGIALLNVIINKSSTLTLLKEAHTYLLYHLYGSA
jgi:hypothetical protein